MSTGVRACPALIIYKSLVALHTGKLQHSEKKILLAIIYGHIPKCSERPSPSATTPVSSWTSSVEKPTANRLSYDNASGSSSPLCFIQ
jgi:hypothetical protein